MINFLRKLTFRVVPNLVILFGMTAAEGRAEQAVRITHQFTNTNAQSLIGLPAGSHKTIIDMQGNLHWSQWNLKHKPQDSTFGFSEQLDGALVIESSLVSGADRIPFRATSQNLYKARFPFVVTHLSASNVQLEELAFAAVSGAQGLDVVRLTCSNSGANLITINLDLSGKWRNLPAFAGRNISATRNGYIVVMADDHDIVFSAKQRNLLLSGEWTIPPGETRTLWLKLPYDFQVSNRSTIENLSGAELLEKAEQSWLDIWVKGIHLKFPQKEIEDFFYSSFAYVLILTERDANGDLWILDGPGGYRQFWGRGEYFQARALEILGSLDLARDSIIHTFHLQLDDGEWDGPPISGWPSWDNTGGNAGAAWDYFLFTKDRDWLAQAYPHLRAAADWIRFHREESDYEAGDVPAGAKPIHRQIPWSCKPESVPPLKSGEKPVWSGLLPWSYGDSGLPEGHSFPHNYFCLYAVRCALDAAKELGRKDDESWLSSEYESYRAAIIEDIRRAVKLEKETAGYLPAMPTDPGAAWSQSFAAVYPVRLLSPDDPLVSGLITQVEKTERQGLPTNMAWMGPSGVWPGESMNVAETYLRRGEVEKTASMLVAALNHSYSTNVFKEEIRVDKSLPVACLNGNKNRENQVGTGDMPEAWGNANMVNLVRDMLLLETDGALRLLTGVPADWIHVGQEISLENAPTTLGGTVFLHLQYPTANKMRLGIVPPSGRATDVIVRFPIPAGQKLTSIEVNGNQRGSTVSRDTVIVNQISAPTRIEVTIQ